MSCRMTDKTMKGVDPYYNSLYAQTHGKELYGTSSIAFLPEVVQAFVHYAQDCRLTLDDKVRVLDYGCGRSILLDVFAKVVNDNRDVIRTHLADFSRMDTIMADLAPALTEAMAGYDRDQYAELLQWDGGIIEKHRYDPAIPEYAAAPQGPYDFLICTDVYEHIPEFGGANGKVPILRDAMRRVADLSANPFLNISTRLAMQILPDDTNAHCTLKTPAEWQELVLEDIPDAIPMLSRDFTSCHFVSGKPDAMFDPASEDSYRRYGEIDLIPWPPKRDMTAEKQAALLAVQDHKNDVRQRNAAWWEHESGRRIPSREFGIK
jgi:hypothetical protein